MRNEAKAPGQRLTMFSLHFPPETTGNAPYTGALARGLSLRGWSVRVVAGHPHYPRWQIWDGYGQWVRREKYGRARLLRLLHYVPSAPTSVRRLMAEASFGIRAIFARWGTPDVVLLVSPALFATAILMLRGRLSRRKFETVVWVQDLYSLGVSETGLGSTRLARIMARVESTTLKAASRVVVIHPRFGEYVVDALKVPASKVRVVRNWTHLLSAPVIDVAETRAHFGWGDDQTVLLHAGNMGAKQGLENVLAAARVADEQNLPLLFVLLGNGNQKSRLVDASSGIERIQFLDSLDERSFQSAMQAADVLLVNEKPGVAEMAVPSKLTSYFTTGRPVLAATDLGGVTASEIAVARAGITVRAGDPAALVEGAMHLRESPTLASELGRNGIAFREQALDEEIALDAFSEVLRFPGESQPPVATSQSSVEGVTR